LASSKKVTLYFVRHGETQFNVEKRMQGFCDSPLTDNGISQAKAVGKGLSGIDFTAAYASESQRVIDTANYAIGHRSIPLTTDARLKEMNFGLLESLLGDEIQAKYGNILEELFTMKDLHLSAPEGETYVQLFQRTSSAVEEIVKRHQAEGGNILVFSHGVTIGNYMMQLTNSPTFPHHQNCGVSIVSYHDGQVTVEAIADMSYRNSGLE